MQSPVVREHIALRYLSQGFSPIPLDPGDKRPHGTLLPGRQWGPYQTKAAPPELVRAWAGMIPEPNWGLVCGQVSHGLYCGDCDDFHYAQWVLAHARDPLLRGACVVRSGSGKAHIWFISPNRLESHVWKPRQGAKVGDVRGDGRPGALGSYMVVPPSIHPDTGQAYEVVAGGFDALPVIDNGDAFLAEILAAYRQEVPEGSPPPPPTSRNVLTLSPEDRLRVQNHVRDLKLKQKIKDTILVQGNQAPGSKHWIGLQDDSRSGIDFAVVCELIRKGQTFDQVEEIFAGSEIGNNRYLAKNIKHSTGYGYLKTTYDNAAREIEEQRRQSRVAKGQNFEVLEVARMKHTRKLVTYSIQVQFTLPNRDPFVKSVEIPSDVLGMEDRFTRAVFDQTGVHPILTANHRGKHNYPSFMQAVSDMVIEDQQVPVAMTREGHFAAELRLWMQILQPRLEPPTLGEASSMGWLIGDTYYLRLREIYRKLQAQRAEFHYEDLGPVLAVLGETGAINHYWPETGETETLVTVTLAPRPRASLPALPAPVPH
jgi:hypothetical protein